jgi:hypothetical protein
MPAEGDKEKQGALPALRMSHVVGEKIALERIRTAQDGMPWGKGRGTGEEQDVCSR